jgi:hypothetical protein
MNKNRKSFDEKNDLITVRPKKIIEQVKTFDGESDFIVPRKNTYIDKKNNTIVSLARDNSHSSVDTVGEYANAAAAPANAIGGGGVTGGANLNYTVQTIPSTPTCQGIGINVNAGGATGGNILVGGQYSATNQSGQIVASQTITQNGKIFNLPLLTDASGTLLDANVVYTISLSYSDDNGSGVALPVQTAISGQLNCTTPPPSGTGGVKGGGKFGVIQGSGSGTTITKNVPPVTIIPQGFSASSSLTQPDTISVNVIYQDGQAPYTVDYTITDPSGNVVVQKTNNTNSLQDSLQPSASGLSAGGYVVTVKVTGSDGSSDTKTENVNVKGKAVVQGKLKINNLNVTTTNPTTTGFDVNLTWADGTSPFQVNATITNGTNAVTHQMPENSNYHSWTQPLIVDASGNTLYGTYSVDVVVTDAVGDSVVGNTTINIQAPKASPLAGQLVATNIQNASFDVSYKFTNGVAPFKLTADLYYPADASGNSYKDTVSQSNLNNTGVFNQFILPDNGMLGGNGTIAEGYYKMTNCVVTDANGQTANLNDIAPYLNGKKGTTTSNVPTPPPATTTTTTTSTTMGGGSGGGGSAEEPTAPEVVTPKDKLGINWLLVIIALGVGYAIIRKKQ